MESNASWPSLATVIWSTVSIRLHSASIRRRANGSSSTIRILSFLFSIITDPGITGRSQNVILENLIFTRNYYGCDNDIVQPVSGYQGRCWPIKRFQSFTDIGQSCACSLCLGTDNRNSASVCHRQFKPAAFYRRADSYANRDGCLGNAVLDRIFNQRLKNQGRDFPLASILTDIYFELQTTGKADLFNLKITDLLGDFLFNRDNIFAVIIKDRAHIICNQVD